MHMLGYGYAGEVMERTEGETCHIAFVLQIGVLHVHIRGHYLGCWEHLHAF